MEDEPNEERMANRMDGRETADGRLVLVVGGTGEIGRHVVRRLVADGYHVRVVTRDSGRATSLFGSSGVEVVIGDVDDAASLNNALRGCFAVHVSLQARGDAEAIDRVEHRGAERIARLAVRNAVRRLTYLSGDFAGDPRAVTSPAERAKHLAEQAIERSGISFTIFKPTYFMETLPRHVHGRFAIALGRPRPVHMVAADDFARQVSRAMRTTEAAGITVRPRGPEAITVRDALELYCAIVLPGTRVVSVPLPVMRAVDKLFLGGAMARQLHTMQLLEEIGEDPDDGATAAILGGARTTLVEWCRSVRHGAVPGQADGQFPPGHAPARSG